MHHSEIPLTVRHIDNETEPRQFIGHDVILYHSGRYFTLLKGATWEKISHYLDKNSFIIDLSDTPFIDVQYKPKREIPPQFKDSAHVPAVPLTVWFKFNDHEIRQFVNRDVILYHGKRSFTLLKRATFENISRLVDEDSFIIDLTDTPVLNLHDKRN